MNKKMHWNMNDITGKEFGRLTVLGDSGKRTKYGSVLWLTECTCGNTKEVRGDHLISERVQSCGCLMKEMSAKRMRKMASKQGGTKNSQYNHGDAGRNHQLARLYQTYHNMRNRCYNKKTTGYQYYGKKGISVCDSWLSDYKTFREWAYNNNYDDTLCIDRINNEGNYEPGNCQFITSSENTKKMWQERKEQGI